MANNLTRQTLRDAFERIRNQAPTVCVGGNKHVVSPTEAERGGLARCANCFKIIDGDAFQGGSRMPLDPTRRTTPIDTCAHCGEALNPKADAAVLRDGKWLHEACFEVLAAGKQEGSSDA